jgi:hypothetical protein
LELVSDEGVKEQLDVAEARSVQKNIIDNKTNKS